MHRKQPSLLEIFGLREDLKPELEQVIQKFSKEIVNLGGDAGKVADALRRFAVEFEKAEGEDPKELETASSAPQGK